MDLKQIVAPALAVIGIACAYYTWFTLNARMKSLEEQLQKTHVLASSGIKVEDLQHFTSDEEAKETDEEETKEEQPEEAETVVRNETVLPRVIPRTLPNVQADSTMQGPPSPASSTSGWSVSEGGAVGQRARRRRATVKKPQECADTASESSEVVN